MDRLSPLDAEFLHLEDGIAHMHIAGVSRVRRASPLRRGPGGTGPRQAPPDPPLSPAGAFGAPRARAPGVGGRPGLRPQLPPAPRGPSGTGRRRGPQPADGPSSCPSPSIEHAPSGRPSWWRASPTVAGRSSSRSTTAWSTACPGSRCSSVLLDVERDVDLPAPEPWQPELEPSAAARVLNAWAGLALDAGALARRMPGLLADPRGLGAFAHPHRAGAGALRPPTCPPPSRCRSRAASGPVGPGRTPRCRLADVKTDPARRSAAP